MKPFFIELEQAAHGETYHQTLAIQIPYSKSIVDGLIIISLWKYLISKYTDREWVFIDASHIRARQHSAGLKDQDISINIGGNSSKIHLAVDSYGNPIEIIITNGITHDVKVTPKLVSKLGLDETKTLYADKGYDSEPLQEQIEATDTQANISQKSNTQSNNDHMDWNLYKIRHLVENAFARLKQFRTIATRYDKLKLNYESAVALACIYIWLSLWNFNWP